MIGRPVALIQVPNQALFRPKAAAQFLGMDVKTLKRLTDESIIQAKWDPYLKQRSYPLEELERYRDTLPDYNPNYGELNPRASQDEGETNGSL